MSITSDVFTLFIKRIGLIVNGDTLATNSIAMSLPAVPAVAADVHAPAAATAAVVTYAATVGKKHYIHSITWSYSAAPTGGNLKIEDVSGTTVFTTDITASGPGQLTFHRPIVSSAANTAMIVTLASGAGAVVGKLSCQHEVK